jgi:hypothetical protein
MVTLIGILPASPQQTAPAPPGKLIEAIKTHNLGFTRRRIAFHFIALIFLPAMELFLTLSAAKALPSSPSQEQEQKAPHLYWNPPQVDARVPSLSTTPPCSLPDVLNQAGQRARELVNHFQRFIAHDQIRYEQTDRLSMGGPSIVTGTGQVNPQQTGLSGAAKFDYVVDFGEKLEPLNIHEYRTRLSGADKGELNVFLDKGLPVLALIFHPALQTDYEMSCEGLTQWNNQPAWVVRFRQLKGKRPRTLTMETTTEVRPHSVNRTELRPLSLKGRAWIAADSAQVMHIETNLTEGILMIDLQELAISVDYAPVTSQSQNGDIWLPKHVVAYTDYANRRMIIEHILSDFQLFSVQTQETVQKPKEP